MSSAATTESASDGFGVTCECHWRILSLFQRALCFGLTLAALSLLLENSGECDGCSREKKNALRVSCEGFLLNIRVLYKKIAMHPHPSSLFIRHAAQCTVHYYAVPMMESMPAAPKSSVVSAAFRALAAWLALYVVVSQILVISKWNSSPAVAQEDVVVVVKDSPLEEKVVETIVPPKRLDAEQKRKIQIIENMFVDIKQAEARHQQLVAATEEKLQLMRERSMQPLLTGESPSSESLVSPKLTFLENLLKRPTLSTATESQLLHLSEQVMEEVNVIAASNASIDWDQVAAVLTARYERAKEQDIARECPAHVSSIPDHLARESHFYQKVQQIEALSKQRAQNLPLLSKEEDMMRLLQERIEELPEQEEEETQDDGRLCVSTQDIEDMVDEGFNALQRRLDLRRVLTKYVLASWPDVNKTDLILDAVLDPPRPKEVAGKDTVNLRHVIDTPLLKETAKWVDAVVDQLSGYNDMVDQFVDNLAAEGPTVGHVLVSNVQALAGKVEVPKVASKIPNKAGMLG